MKKKGTSEPPEDIKQLLRQYDENPYDPGRKKPEDVMRVFYQFDISILPVVSSKNLLIGIIAQKQILSEMSDLERFREVPIDKFITGLAQKMNLDEILPYISKQKEFVTINIFGEVQNNWTRLDLINACENVKIPTKNHQNEIDLQKEKQTMEWMIYLILEHIPRSLFALNEKGKLIFYNSYFEDFYLSNMGVTEVDIDFLEKSIASAEKNDFFYRNNKKEIYFYNLDISFYYEKVPMYSNGKQVGFLIYCNKQESPAKSSVRVDGESIPLKEQLDLYEHQIIVNTLKKNDSDLSNTAKELGITKNSLLRKIEKFNIKLKS